MFLSIFANAQSFALKKINNINSADLGLFKGKYIVYKNKLYFSYRNSSYNQKYLGQFDGTSVTKFSNPDNGRGVDLETFDAFIKNDILYFLYLNDYGKFQLAKFDGKAVSLIANPDNGYGIFSDKTFTNKNKLYFYYTNEAGQNQLAQFNGNSLSLISNPDNGQGVHDRIGALVNDTLFFGYSMSTVQIPQPNGNSPVTYTEVLAKFDGDSIKLVPIYLKDFGGGYKMKVELNDNGNIFSFQNNIYYPAGYDEYIKYDGFSTILIAKPNIPNFYHFSTERPIINNGKLYIKYDVNTNYSDGNLGTIKTTKLARLNNDVFNTITTSDDISFGTPFIYGSSLYYDADMSKYILYPNSKLK
jgi:hypothetical protein